ncbi:MAG: ABC transporter ATP-binding protein [Clostridia bacterium]|nr:ABC transporter ATP-binding protein [Clostridia bacterium]
MIRAKGVIKDFDGFRAINALDMHVEKGSIYGLVGPNGAGKTTLINHITGMLKQDSGSITIDGEETFDNPSLHSRVLSISDDWFYYGSFTVEQMAQFYKDMYKQFNTERFNNLKQLFKIDPKRQIRRLSKGMKKQVAFHLVLSCMPDVLILDEPLDGLDPVMRKQILNIIINDVARREMTVLVSSHNLRELEDICDHIGIIHQGRMIIEKPLDDLKGNVHKYQLVFDGDFPEDITQKIEILHSSKIGSVHNLIVRGDKAETTKIFASYMPLVCEMISLTLEEVFIYELGGLGYDFQGILV